MATIRKWGNRWQVSVRRKGYAPIYKSFQKKADAQEWARFTEQQADRRSLPYDPKKLDSITLAGLLEKYRDEVIPLKRSTERETNLLNAFIRRNPKLSALSLSAVTVAHFCSYRDERLKTVKPASLCRELGLIQHAYDIAAKEWGYTMPENPVAKVKKPEIRNRRERRLTFSEAKALIGALTMCKNEVIKPMTLFAMQTGMRRSEILAAEWKHLNIETRILHIPLTKNGYARTIPLTGRAIKILKTIKKEEWDQKKIFPVSEEAFRMAWRRTMERSGIENLTFHDLRHEAVSRFFEKGLSVPEVALISGHRDFRMLFRYTHMRPEDVAAKLK